MAIVLSTLDPEKIYPDQKNFDGGNAKINKFVHDSLKGQVRKGLIVAYVLTDSLKKDKFVGFFTIAQHSINVGTFSLATRLVASTHSLFQVNHAGC